jgi:hypothetical protein
MGALSLSRTLAKSDRPSCPLWIKARHSTMSASCLLHPDKRTLIIGFCTSALGHKRAKSNGREFHNSPISGLQSRTVTVFVRRSIASRELKVAFRLVGWRVANRRRLCRPVKFRRVTDCMPLVARRSRAALRIRAAGPGFSTSRRCG